MSASTQPTAATSLDVSALPWPLGAAAQLRGRTCFRVGESTATKGSRERTTSRGRRLCGTAWLREGPDGLIAGQASQHQRHSQSLFPDPASRVSPSRTALANTVDSQNLCCQSTCTCTCIHVDLDSPTRRSWVSSRCCTQHPSGASRPSNLSAPREPQSAQ